MRRITVVSAVVCGIVLGCAGSQVAKSPWVPPAHAEGTYVHWQYACYADDPGPKFTELGRAGWELVGYGGQSSPVWCFKRPY